MEVHTEILIKGGLSLVALAAVVLRHLRPGKLPPERAGQLLWIVALLAVLAWPNFGLFHGRSGVHHWELFHYFLGSKYFPELRYDGLYAASLAAERELGPGGTRQYYARDLRNNEVVPVVALEEHGRQVKARFTPERWRAFVADNGFFIRSNSADYLNRIRCDHGYNPTPTWTFTARLFSRWPAASTATLNALAWLDPLLLLVLFIAVFRSYGSRVGCMALIIFGVGYPWRFDWVGGAFLRQDWLVASGLAVCALGRRRHAAAGALLAYATMVRVFPGAFLVGPAVLAARALLRRERLDWAWRLGAGFAGGAVACALAGCLTGAGAEAWPQLAHNLAKHHDTWLTNNVGLTNVLLYDGATMRREEVDWSLAEPWLKWQSIMNRRQSAYRPWLVAATTVFLLWLAAAAWRQRLDQAAVLGIAVAFAALLLTCYYWAMLLLLPVGRGRWGPSAGWLAINSALFALHLATPSFEMIYGLLSWALAVFFLAWTAPDAVASARELLRRSRA